MYNYHDNQCPYHKKNFDKKKDSSCQFGKVEQDNENTQNASIVQESNQNNYFIVFCGDKGGKPTIGGLSIGKDKKMPKLDLNFDEEGNIVVNGKTLKGKDVGEGVKMYALREKKTSNKFYGNPPEEIAESVEEYPVEEEYADEEDYWDFDY